MSVIAAPVAFVIGAALAAMLVSQWEIERRVMPRWERYGWVLMFASAVAAATVETLGWR